MLAAGGGGGGMTQPNGAKEEHFVPITIVCRHVKILHCRIIAFRCFTFAFAVFMLCDESIYGRRVVRAAELAQHGQQGGAK
jgi:hypothetical protein